MPLRTEIVDFAEEREQLREEMVEYAEEQANYDGENESRVQQLMSRGNQLDRYATVLRKIEDGEIEGLPAFDSVTLAGLSPGEINRVEDTTDANQGVRERDAWVAIGTHDESIPYVQHDPENVDQAAYEESVTYLVSNVPLPYIRWAEERISDLSHLGADEGNGYLQLVQEKRQDDSTN